MAYSCRQNFGFGRACGILMPVSSLPSPFGIGNFGRGAYDFIDFLDRCGQRCWQVLPMNPTSYGDSPYQSPASIAGNPYFIDPQALRDQKLLTAEELASARCAGERVDYGFLFYTRYDLFRRAYARFTPDAEFGTFCRRQKDWLEDYALFMALKCRYSYRAWTEWPQEYRDVTRARERADELAEEMGFWKWIQYEFMRQWRAVRAYAKGKGIAIIGDMPIYVAHDSMDVWRAPDQFLLDEQYAPTVVAGCPPDAYSEVGQLWGNPIYNWERMREDGYAWWIDRVRHSMELYDLLRIDHFRGFASYYTIAAGETTAIHGTWNEGPGEALFAAIRRAHPRAKIIAEDLGYITEDVKALLAATDFPGMKVLQFAFYNDDSEYLPRCFTTDNCIVYTATHDSPTSPSWYAGLGEEEKARFAWECPRRRGQSATDAMIELAMRSRAHLAVITMQDYLHLPDEAGRMNIPSVAAGNWTWRVSPRYGTQALCRRIRELCERGGRLKKQKSEKTVSEQV